MTEAPDVYPDPTSNDEDNEVADDGVEGHLQAPTETDEIRTGDARVDAVLEAMTGLDDRPVTEHAALFERAHEQLRAALDPDREPDVRSA